MSEIMKFSEDSNIHFWEYFFKLQRIFKNISEKLKIPVKKNIFDENLFLSKEAFDAYNTEHLDFLLYENGTFYEVFASYSGEEFFKLDEKILKNILQWKLKIVFLENFSKIVILNEDNFPEKIEKVIN